MKRFLTILLLAALVITAFNVNPAHPTAAKAADVGMANADLLPGDTALYMNFHVADLSATVSWVGGIYQKVSGAPMPDVFAQIDQGLTQTLKRDASFAKDIQPWLGDDITAGMSITDDQIAALANPATASSFNPQFVAIISVKDAAAADKFFQDLAAATSAFSMFTTRTDTVGGKSVKIYDQTNDCSGTCGSIVQADTYLAIGTTAGTANMLSALKSSAPKLDANPNFVKVMTQLKPNSLLSVFVAPRIYSLLIAGMAASSRAMNTIVSTLTPGKVTPVPTPDTTAMMQQMQQALAAINGQAFALRREDKVLAFDFAQSVNLDALAKVYTSMGIPADTMKQLMPQALAGKLGSQIPAKSVFVIEVSSLAKIYQTIKIGLKSAAKFSGGIKAPNMPNYNDIAANLDKAESYLKLSFNLDVQQDILSWMDSEFALYTVFDQNSSLSKLNKNGGWPFDHTLLVNSTDAGKTKAFLDKLNTGLTKNLKMTPKSAGTDLYTLTIPNGPDLSYGLVGSTFLVTNSSGLDGAKAAINGDGVIADSPAWKAAQASAVQPAYTFWYVDLTQISAIVKLLVPAAQMSKPDTQMALKFFDMLQSVTLSASPLSGDGMSTGSFQLLLK